MENTLKIPPHNERAEQEILGAMLLNRETVEEVLNILDESCFYLPHHEIIFYAMNQLHSMNQTIDIVTVSDFLEKKGILQDVGGYGFLTKLATDTGFFSGFHHVKQHSLIVKEAAIKRNAINAFSELLESCYDPDSKSEEILEMSEQTIFLLDNDRFTQDLEHMGNTFQEKGKELIRYIENGGMTDEDKEKLISSGISSLDDLIRGGFHPGSLYVLAARPAMGKSGLAVNLATNIAQHQSRPVAIFSMEMIKEDITERIISSETGFSSYDFRGGRVPVSKANDVQKVVNKLSSTPMYIYDKGSLSTNDIKTKIRKLKTQKKEIGLVVVDYLQLLEGRGNNRETIVASIARDLKNIALELQVPILALSQLNRGVENKKEKIPTLADLRESGEIENSADVIMFIYRDEYYNPDTDKKKIASIIVAKHRGGPVGDVDLFFDASLTKFSALEDGKGY